METRNPSLRPTLLIGSSGLLGGSLARELERRRLATVAPLRRELDLGRPEMIPEGIRSLAPGCVINAAAFSDVTRAELPEHREEAYLVNRDGAESVARACAAMGIPLVHISTDYVFDGTCKRPYREKDATGPLQVYGRSKLEGEKKVLAAHPGSLVVRTSTLFGSGRIGRPNYVDSIVNQARRTSLVEVVEPPVSSPTYTPDLAEGILKLLARGSRGVVHVVNGGSCSRLELARAVVEWVGLAGRVEVRSRQESPGALRRPAYSVLDCSLYESVTGKPLRTWREALKAHLAGVSTRP